MLVLTAYLRTNLTLRHLALLFGVSRSAADRIIDHLGNGPHDLQTVLADPARVSGPGNR